MSTESKHTPGPQVNLAHLRDALSTCCTPAPWQLEAMWRAIQLVAHDKHFQAALQRYAHANGSSQAVAQAAIAAIARATA